MNEQEEFNHLKDEIIKKNFENSQPINFIQHNKTIKHANVKKDKKVILKLIENQRKKV